MTQNEQVKEKAKWWETEGMAFTENDIVYIDTSYDSIGGRFARITEPSQKPHHYKAKMQNRKTGEEQGSTIIISSKLSTLVAHGGFGEPVNGDVSDQFEMDAAGIYHIKEALKRAN